MRERARGRRDGGREGGREGGTDRVVCSLHNEEIPPVHLGKDGRTYDGRGWTHWTAGARAAVV